MTATRLQDQVSALRAFRVCAHEAVIASSKVAVAELRLAEPDASLPALSTAETALVFAARRLVDATNALPPERRPRNWGGGL